MAESPHGRLSPEPAPDGALDSIADVTAAIRETRARLATRLFQATQQIDVLLSAPPKQRRGSSEAGLLPFAFNAIAAVRRGRAGWRRASQARLLRKVAVGGAVIGLAAVLVVRRKWRDPRQH